MLVTRSCQRLFMTPWTLACQAPLSKEFSRQEQLSGLPFPSPGYLPHPGIEPGLLDCRQILDHLSHQRSPQNHKCWYKIYFSPLESLPLFYPKLPCQKILQESCFHNVRARYSPESYNLNASISQYLFQFLISLVETIYNSRIELNHICTANMIHFFLCKYHTFLSYLCARYYSYIYFYFRI